MCYTQHLSQNSCGFSSHDRNVTTKCLLPDFFKNLPFSFGYSEILINFDHWSKVLTLENTSKNEKTFLFVWYFAHLIVSLQHEIYIEVNDEI